MQGGPPAQPGPSNPRLSLQRHQKTLFHRRPRPTGLRLAVPTSWPWSNPQPWPRQRCRCRRQRPIWLPWPRPRRAAAAASGQRPPKVQGIPSKLHGGSTRDPRCAAPSWAVAPSPAPPGPGSDVPPKALPLRRSRLQPRRRTAPRQGQKPGAAPKRRCRGAAPAAKRGTRGRRGAPRVAASPPRQWAPWCSGSRGRHPRQQSKWALRQRRRHSRPAAAARRPRGFPNHRAKITVLRGR
mmetsp:Transcript_81212/g.263246  ORF Transcript_81212/g.263246 Transcript_81212/m.263246 type:complete len:238 (+) Transcript_81212:232-945(+)